jgi:hypothetical protein
VLTRSDAEHSIVAAALARPTMRSFESPAAVFQAAAKGLAAEDFRAVADCIDPFSLRAFRDELLESQRGLPLRDRFASLTSPDEVFIEWLRSISPRASMRASC